MKKLIAYLILFLTVKSIAGENSLYDFKWLDEGEKVYVIQNKEYIKSGSLGIDLSINDSNSSPYQDTLGLTMAMTYYFNENWSIDFTYKKYNNKESQDLTNLLSLETNEGPVKPLVRRIDAAKIIHINWIPFYGKINTFNAIFFFDWGFGLGAGQFETAGNYKTFLQRNISLTMVEEIDTGYNMRSFVKFYIGSSLTMGFEYNISGVQTIKNQEGTKSTLYYNDIMATIGYLF